jgi:hypothetical protein
MNQFHARQECRAEPGPHSLAYCEATIKFLIDRSDLPSGHDLSWHHLSVCYGGDREVRRGIPCRSFGRSGRDRRTGLPPRPPSGVHDLGARDAAASWAARSLLGMTEISRRAGWSAGFQNACGVGRIYRKQTRERIRGGIRPTARDMKTSVRPAQIAPRSACTQPVLRAVFSKVDTLAVFMAWFLPAPRQGVYRRRRACARPYRGRNEPALLQRRQPCPRPATLLGERASAAEDQPHPAQAPLLPVTGGAARQGDPRLSNPRDRRMKTLIVVDPDPIGSGSCRYFAAVTIAAGVSSIHEWFGG